MRDGREELPVPGQERQPSGAENVYVDLAGEVGHVVDLGHVDAAAAQGLHPFAVGKDGRPSQGDHDSPDARGKDQARAGDRAGPPLPRRAPSSCTWSRGSGRRRDRQPACRGQFARMVTCSDLSGVSGCQHSAPGIDDDGSDGVAGRRRHGPTGQLDRGGPASADRPPHIIHITPMVSACSATLPL